MIKINYFLLLALLFLIAFCPSSSFSQHHDEYAHEYANDSLRQLWQDESLENEKRLEALDHLAVHIGNMGYIEELFSLHQELYDFSVQREMPDRIVQALDKLAMISVRYIYSPNESSPPDNAIHFCKEAIAIAKKIDDERLPQLYMYQGLAYILTQDFDQGMESYLFAYQLLEHKKDSVSQQYLGMTAYRLAKVYYRSVGDIEKAISYWEKALAVAEESEFDLDFIKANALIQLGYQYYDSGELDQADRYLTTAYNLGHKMIPVDYHSAIMNLASVRIEQRRDEEAMTLIREYEALGKELGFGDQKGIVNDHIGKIHLLNENIEEALKHYQIALESAENINDYGAIETYRWQISLINENLGNYEEALVYFKGCMEARDSVYNEEQQRQVYRQESRYEYEKQALADSLAFAQKEAITNLELERISE